jgi:hypothetical protein
MVIAPNSLNWTAERASVARDRYQSRNIRLARQDTLQETPVIASSASKASILEEVMARVKARRASQAVGATQPQTTNLNDDTKT